jgi:tetratricopeptide (TPR) repeat protein
MYKLKRLAADSVERTLQKAERYRLLGEPCEAESICVDVLEVDPDNNEALIMLILSLTDQFRDELVRVTEVKRLIHRLEDPYERFYYSGIAAERYGKAQFARGGPGSDSYAHGALWEALTWYEKAEALRPPANDDAILRWNSCARVIDRWGLTVPLDESERLPLMPE